MAGNRGRSTGRRRSRGAGYTLDTKLNGATMRHLWYRTGAIVLLLTALAGSAYAAYRGALYVRDMTFSANPRFTIRTIRIQDGRIKTADMIREYLAYKGIAEGANLFGFDLVAFRDEYLAYNPVVRQMTLRRQLPDTLEVAIVERTPLARLGQRASLVSDREGFVFRLSTGLHELPVVIGNTDPTLAPGQVVSGLTRAAVEVLAVCENPRLGLLVLGVDIRKGDYLILHLVAPTGIKEARVAWHGMGGPVTDESHADLVQRLIRVRQLLEQDPGHHTHLDVTFEDRAFAD